MEDARPRQRLTPDRAHAARRLLEEGAVDEVAGFLAPHGGPQKLGDLFVARAVPHGTAEVVLLEREQAGPNLPVGGEADAIAMAAERPGHRGDHAYSAAAVEVAVHRGRGARVGDARRL